MSGLDDLKHALLRMGGLVEEMIASAVRAIATQNPPEALAVVERDAQVDDEELRVDAICMDLLRASARESDVLRYVTAGMKIGTDLERMADLAVGIAIRGRYLMERPLPAELSRVEALAALVCGMVRKALQAFVGLDAGVARGLARDEEKADALCSEMELRVKELLAGGRASVDEAFALLLIARALERIGDHVTNVAEDVIYIAEGQVARHSPWMRA